MNAVQGLGTTHICRRLAIIKSQTHETCACRHHGPGSNPDCPAERQALECCPYILLINSRAVTRCSTREGLDSLLTSHGSLRQLDDNASCLTWDAGMRLNHAWSDGPQTDNPSIRPYTHSRTHTYSSDGLHLPLFWHVESAVGCMSEETCI